jgi:S1-C subfamily serine protease
VEEQRKIPVLRIVALLAALGLAMACGVVLGGGGVYLLTEVLGERGSLGVFPAVTVLEGPGDEGEVRVVVGGATILAVVPDSPAEEAGLLTGDRVVAVDGQEIGLLGELAALIAQHKPGDRVMLDVVRSDGDETRVKVRLGEHPDNEGIPYLGVRYSSGRPLVLPEGMPVPFGETERFGFDFDFEAPLDLAEGEVIEGTWIVGIEDGGPADVAGVQEGDVITAVDGRPVARPQELVEAVARLEPGDETVLSIYRMEDGEELEITMVLGEHPSQKETAYLGVEIRGYFRMQGGVSGELPGLLRFYAPSGRGQVPHSIPPNWLPNAQDDT